VPELRGLLERALRLAPGLPQIDDELLMRLHFALAHSIFHMLGPVDQVSQSLESALAIADRRGDVNAQLQILSTRFGNLVYKGDYANAMPTVERVRSIMINSPEAPVAPLYNRMAALAFHLLGEQQKALRHAELALDHAAVKQRAGRDGVFVYDHKTAASAHYSRILWITGSPDSALEVIRGVIEDARSIDQPFAIGFLLVFAAVPVSLWAGELQAAHRHVSSLLDVASGITFNVWRSAGMIYQQALDFLENDGHADSAIPGQTALDDSLTPFLMDNLTTFSWQLSHPRATAAALDGGVHWCTAEFLRAKGERLLASGRALDRQEAAELFQRSIEISRAQKALSWELRSATSLARLWHAENRTLQAANLLTGVYRRFTEGFATRDLSDAKALLDSF